MASVRITSWRATASSITSGARSHNVDDPSISVKRNVNGEPSVTAENGETIGAPLERMLEDFGSVRSSHAS
jgi:hypothetical protein